MVDQDGNPLHDDITNWVGLAVEMKGEVEQWDDWLVIKTNPNQDLSWDKPPAKWLANWGRKFLSEDDEGCPYHIDSKFAGCL